MKILDGDENNQNIIPDIKNVRVTSIESIIKYYNLEHTKDGVYMEQLLIFKINLPKAIAATLCLGRS
jgi:hypothetical protein